MLSTFVKEHFDFPQSAELIAELDAVARRCGSREQAFDDLLTLSVCALAGGTCEDEYLRTVKPYTDGEPGKRPIDRLVAVFARIVTLMEETRADILGDLFQGGITRGQNQQFFTPDPLCELMARLTHGGATSPDDESRGRKTVSDPCCGSGRLLLASAKVDRNQYFIGQDIDHRCAKITAINLALWNLYGAVVWGNTLSGEQWRIYHTGFDGKGVIRIEETQTTPPLPPEPQASPSPKPRPGAAPSHQPTLFDEPAE